MLLSSNPGEISARLLTGAVQQALTLWVFFSLVDNAFSCSRCAACPGGSATFKQPVRKKCAPFGFAGFFDGRVVWVQARSSATGLNVSERVVLPASRKIRGRARRKAIFGTRNIGRPHMRLTKLLQVLGAGCACSPQRKKLFVTLFIIHENLRAELGNSGSLASCTETDAIVSYLRK